MGGLLNGIRSYRGLDGRIYAILEIRCSPALIEQCIDSAVSHRFLLAIEGVSRDAHHLVGFGYIAKFFRQIQQTDFVFDDLVVSMKHEGYLFVF